MTFVVDVVCGGVVVVVWRERETFDHLEYIQKETKTFISLPLFQKRWSKRGSSEIILKRGSLFFTHIVIHSKKI